MASNKVKFKMMIKEIAFEFEGDYEQGRQLQQGINNTMQGLANLQNRSMGLPEPASIAQTKLIDSRSVEPVRRRRKKRTPSVNPNEGVESTTETSDNMMPDSDAETNISSAGSEMPPRRNSGVSPKTLLINLRKSGFFGQKRAIGEIVNKLHTDGYPMMEQSGISSTLISLCRSQVLAREKNEAKKWVYAQGPNEQ